MKTWFNVVSQIALGAGQVANIVYPALSGKNQVIVGGAIAGVQLVVSAIAHNYNPDGTSVKVAYAKPVKDK